MPQKINKHFMKVKITLTEDMLRLISAIRFEQFNFDDKESFNQLKKTARQLVRVDQVPKEDYRTESSMFNDYKMISDLNKELLDEIRDMQPNERFGWGIDKYGMFGGSYVLEDIALLIGKWNEAIPGTELETGGRRYPQELEDYMFELYQYIVDNMVYIESLVHTFCTKGGLTPGTYTCHSNELDWKKLPDKK